MDDVANAKLRWILSRFSSAADKAEKLWVILYEDEDWPSHVNYNKHTSIRFVRPWPAVEKGDENQVNTTKWLAVKLRQHWRKQDRPDRFFGIHDRTYMTVHTWPYIHDRTYEAKPHLILYEIVCRQIDKSRRIEEPDRNSAIWLKTSSRSLVRIISDKAE